MNLIYFPNEILSKTSETISDFYKVPYDILDQMKEVLIKTKGLGLSAVQVGIPITAFLMKDGDQIIEVINPTILAYGSETSAMTEGCLSAPGEFGVVTRPKTIAVVYYDRNGNEQNRGLEGLPARIFQHEYDHLHGKAFFEAMNRENKRKFKKYYKGK